MSGHLERHYKVNKAFESVEDKRTQGAKQKPLIRKQDPLNSIKKIMHYPQDRTDTSEPNESSEYHFVWNGTEYEVLENES